METTAAKDRRTLVFLVLVDERLRLLVLGDARDPPERGCLDGSWDPCGGEHPSWERRAGRVHATTMNTLTTEIYYGYASAFGAKR
jgi:hypothetical protein